MAVTSAKCLRGVILRLPYPKLRLAVTKSGLTSLIMLPSFLLMLHTLSEFGVGSDFQMLFGFIFLALVLMAYPFQVSPYHRFVTIIIFFLGVFVLQTSLPVLSGPDAHAYYSSTTDYDFNELSRFFLDNFDFLSLSLVSSKITFPTLLELTGMTLNDFNPKLVAIPNIFFWSIACFLWASWTTKAAYPYIKHSKTLQIILWTLLLILPSSIYWSSVFAKDITVISIAVFSAIAFHKRRIFLGIFWLVVATLLRPYAVAIVVSLCLLLEPGWKKQIGAATGAIGVLFLSTKGSFVALINMPIMAGYFFVSPNPMDSQNWLIFKDTGTWVLSPALLTVEGIFLGGSFIFGTILALFLNSRTRPLFFALAASIVIGACTLTLVGYHRQMILEKAYGIGVLGENIVRKKIAFWPLIVTWISLVWVIILSKCLPNKLARNHELLSKLELPTP
jgi:hypothetical protein